MAGDLDGQVAIVTGGGRGIGRTIAETFAAAGAAVAVAARSADELTAAVTAIERAGGRALALPTDIIDRPAVEHLMAEAERQLGPVDVLVNNAGIGAPSGPFEELDPDVWWRNIEVNLKGPVLCTRAVLPAMLARGRGRIINVASSAAMLPYPYLSAYATSKTGLVHFTESVALEVRDRGVSLFSIHPGAVHTRMTERTWAFRGTTAPLPGWLGRTYFGPGEDLREADAWKPPERAAELCLFLASGHADALTGRMLRVYDDEHELVAQAAEIERAMLYTLRLPTLQGIERPMPTHSPVDTSGTSRREP